MLTRPVRAGGGWRRCSAPSARSSNREGAGCPDRHSGSPSRAASCRRQASSSASATSAKTASGGVGSICSKEGLTLSSRAPMPADRPGLHAQDDGAALGVNVDPQIVGMTAAAVLVDDAIAAQDLSRRGAGLTAEKTVEPLHPLAGQLEVLQSQQPAVDPLDEALAVQLQQVGALPARGGSRVVNSPTRIWPGPACSRRRASSMVTSPTM